MSELFKDLNESQQEAVRHINGPSLVIAGAGAGKTRVLTYRIAYLLECGVPAFSILALTFTNKAAGEMKQRISKLISISDITKQLWMGTFHSIFAKILRIECEKVKYPPNYTIYDTDDSRSLLRSIIKELNLDDKTYKANEIHNRISWAKNNFISAQQYNNIPELLNADKVYKKPETGRIYEIYSIRCFHAGAMDFDDLLVNANILFDNFKDVLNKYQKKFRFILVDEYQDTNHVQYLLLKKLSEMHRNICVVGDDAQSIYGFRGAKIENILNFKHHYPDYTLFKLERNYRSTQTIVNASNSLIANNKEQIPKKIWSKNEYGSKIKIVKALTDHEEGNLITDMILDNHLTEHFKFSDFAILYRTNAQSRIFEEALRQRNIPYRIFGGIAFYQRKEIKDALAYFRLIINHNDDEALKRIINYPARGIGDVTIEKLMHLAVQQQTSIWTIINSIDNYNNFFNKGTIHKIKEFIILIMNFAAKLRTINAYDLALEIVTTTEILKDLYNDKSPEGVSRYENVHELLNSISEFTTVEKETDIEIITLDKYLENVALLTNEDTDKNPDLERVTLMTVHSAKGLEFKNVYIVGVEKDLFPSVYSSSSAKELEEERRLFYVALTRAEKNAVISYSTMRYRWGSLQDCTPSRFIKEISAEFVDWPDKTRSQTYDGDIINNQSRFVTKSQTPFIMRSPKKKSIEEKVKLKRIDIVSEITKTVDTNKFQNLTNHENITVGMQVEHARFGKGKVIHIEGNFPDCKAVINFENAGQKKLLLKFARLQIIQS